jgi:hypothetical protein
MILCTHIRLNPFAILSSTRGNDHGYSVCKTNESDLPFVNMTTSVITADKTDGANSRMIAYGVNGGNATMDNVQNSRGKACNEN